MQSINQYILSNFSFINKLFFQQILYFKIPYLSKLSLLVSWWLKWNELFDPFLCLGFEYIQVCNCSQAHWELVVESAAPVIEASPGDWQLVIDYIATWSAEVILRWTMTWHKIFITVYWLLSQHCLVNGGQRVQGCVLVHWELSTDFAQNRDWSVRTKSSKWTENFIFSSQVKAEHIPRW